MLTGKYLDAAWPEGARFTRYRQGDARTKAMTARFVSPKTHEVTRHVHEIAAGCGIDPVTFAVAWTLTRDFVGSTIIGVTHPDQLEAHLAAAETSLPEEALVAVDTLSREIRYPLG